MNRNCIPTRQAVAKVPNTFVTIGAMTVFLLTLGTARAATPVATAVAVAQNDAATAQQVYAALNADPTYFYRHVDVHVEHGIVTLGGYVWSTPALYHAKEIAAEVPGVTRVIDEMELERDGVAPHA
jgi:osmotically-inducible protein OsmY